MHGLTGGSWKRDTTGQGHHSGTTLRETAGTQGCGAYSRLDVHAPAPDPTVWLYHRFPLSLRDVEQMMAQRGVIVSYDTIHQWCRKFGQTYATGLRRRRPRPGDKWHLDEVFIKIGGETHYLWRAVDQDGVVLDILVTSRRDAKAATRFFRKLLRGVQSVPRVLVTDKLASYGVAHRRLIPGVEHRRSKYLNNRAENSHQPTRQRERAMKKFRSPGGAQRFLSAFSEISPHFRPRRHRLTAAQHRHEMTIRFTTWRPPRSSQRKNNDADVYAGQSLASALREFAVTSSAEAPDQHKR